MQPPKVQIETLKSEREALEILIQQLQKDFWPIELEFQIPQEPKVAFQSLLSQLVLQLKPLLDAADQALFNALYRVDIPDKSVSELLGVGGHGDVANHLAALILERELIKVAYRKLHS